MSLTPDVTVVIPVGAVNDDLRAQLSALADQRAEGMTAEFVLALNVSTNEARSDLSAAVEALGDERFRIVDATDRRGAAHARNVGAAAAGAQLLAFCDADDVVEPGWLAALVGALSTEVAVGGHLERLGEKSADRWERPPATPGALPTFVGVPYIVSANLGVRRSAFEEVGGFDESLVTGEDTALSWQLIRHGHHLGYVPTAVVMYRSRTGLWPMLRQHYWYGRGMSQLLVRHGVPATPGGGDGRSPLLRANAQAGGRGSYVRFLRRASIAVGRGYGLLDEWRRGRRTSAAPRV